MRGSTRGLVVRNWHLQLKTIGVCQLYPVVGSCHDVAVATVYVSVVVADGLVAVVVARSFALVA